MAVAMKDGRRSILPTRLREHGTVRLPAREQAAVLADLVRQRLALYDLDDHRDLLSELLIHVYRMEDRIINGGWEQRR